MHVGVSSESRITDSELDDIAASRDRGAEQEARRDLLRHPIYKMIRNAQGGFVPSRAELDELKLPTQNRAALEAAIKKLTSLREAGEFGEAHQAYEAMGIELVESLPADMQASDYLAADEPLDTRGPDELAADVARW